MRKFISRKTSNTIFASLLIVVIFSISNTNEPSIPVKKLDAFGICSGYSLKLLDQILKDALDAVNKYLEDYQPVTILGNFSEVDPILESSEPHLCPKSLDSLTIPPGATKAFMVGVDHYSKISTYTGNNPTIAKGIKNNPYTTSNIIVAFYPDKGWIGVYDNPGAYGGFHF